MRAGLALASQELIAQLAKVKDSYNVNRLSQAAAAAAIADEEYRQQTSERIKATRGRLSRRLTDLGLVVPPTQANFLFAALPNGPARRSRMRDPSPDSSWNGASWCGTSIPRPCGTG